MWNTHKDFKVRDEGGGVIWASNSKEMSEYYAFKRMNQTRNESMVK